ncbi:MAG: sigma-54-dependent Fis family transcriptional regulator [Myxococcales bacterium]|nr:sigma-54-dependent Fis family transcriptional regulator [Myxococcales bacterium]
MAMKNDILVVDDDSQIRSALLRLFRKSGHEIVAAESGEAAVKLLEKQPFDLLISDLRMPGMDGIALLRKAKQWDPEIDVIILTGSNSVADAVRAIKYGAYDYLEKPVQGERLLAIVTHIFERRQLKQQARVLEAWEKQNYLYHGMVGKSRPMQLVFQAVQRMARYDSPVLVVGETGTGKDLVAKAIHQISPRAAGPFVAVNGAGLIDSLFESQLFGHRKGSFTGALKDQIGLMEAANGGSLFIDEVGDLSLASQAKLLRALETGEILPVGDTRSRQVDIRLIAATNRNLARDMKDGRFREDLYYRLRGFFIPLPPLREREEDIALLAKYFFRQTVRENGLSVEGFEPRIYEVFEAYSWPGNVRELKQAVTAAAIMASDKLIVIGDLTPELQTFAGSLQEPRVPSAPAPITDRTQPVVPVAPDPRPTLSAGDLSIAHFNKEHVKQVLQLAKGRKGKAAVLLGVSRHTLYRMLKKYDL